MPVSGFNDLMYVDCPTRDGLSQKEVEDIIIPLLQNRTVEIRPVILETMVSVRVEFSIEHYRRHAIDSIFGESPSPEESAFKAAAAKLIKRHSTKRLPPVDIEQINDEFKAAERLLLRLDPSGETLDATELYGKLEFFRDKCLGKE